MTLHLGQKERWSTVRARVVTALFILLPLVGCADGRDTDQVEAEAAPSVTPCEGPDADPWVAEVSALARSFDPLLAFTAEVYGPPIGCEGSVTTVFDGMDFGEIRLVFAEGVTFEIETLPPETSITTLRDPSGFGDEGPVRDALTRYTQERGLEIDWSRPTSRSEGGEVHEVFWDPEEGVNGSASLISVDGVLVAVRLSVAL